MLVILRALFGQLVDIVLLRRGPEHLPASRALLTTVVVVNLVLYGVAYHNLIAPLMPEASSDWPLQMIAGSLITLAWFRVSFQLAHKTERFVQTMIAVFATNILLIPAMPLFAALLPYMQKPNGEPAPATLVLLTLLIAGWVLAVLVHIVRSAFEWSWAGSIVFVFASSFGPAILLSILFGVAQKAA
jgi:hypothetical protein